jgi:hypothetical protein
MLPVQWQAVKASVRVPPSMTENLAPPGKYLLRLGKNRGSNVGALMWLPILYFSSLTAILFLLLAVGYNGVLSPIILGVLIRILGVFCVAGLMVYVLLVRPRRKKSRVAARPFVEIGVDTPSANRRYKQSAKFDPRAFSGGEYTAEMEHDIHVFTNSICEINGMREGGRVLIRDVVGTILTFS